MKTIVDYWYSKHPLLFLLLPFSYLYQLGYFIHKSLYQLGIKKKYQARVPVVIVGNISVGGTGKTPLVIAIAKFLLNQGYKPGIITRGYGGKGSNCPNWVLPSSDPLLVGDEALLIATKVDCPVVVSPNRRQAIQMILDQAECNVIIGDDGLQHHALKRDIEIAVVDGERQHGNGFCLPAGPLREPLKRLLSVNFIVETNGKSSANYPMVLEGEKVVNLLDSSLCLDLSSIQNRIHAIAGIGHPDRFFNKLIKMGLEIVKHPFPDHHHYSQEDLAFCKENEMIIMTEKDAVKCRSFVKKNYWILPVQANVSLDFFENLLTKLKAVNSKS